MITFQLIFTAFILVYTADVVLTHYWRVKLLNLKHKQINNKSYLSTSKTKYQDDKNKSQRGR